MTAERVPPRTEATARHFADADAMTEALLGKKPSTEEKEWLAWYEELRLALRHCRRVAGLSQEQVAQKVDRPQSEISRLERGLGPATSLGRIKDYVAATGGRFDWSLRDPEGRVVSSIPPTAEATGTFAEPLVPIAGGLLGIGEMKPVVDTLSLVDRELAELGVDFYGRQRVVRRVLAGLVHAAGAATVSVAGTQVDAGLTEADIEAIREVMSPAVEAETGTS